MQKDIAEKLGMTTVGFNQLAGATMPKIETFVKVANALGVPVWSLLLTDDELEDIRATAPKQYKASNKFQCPKCGILLRVFPDNAEK